jgi:phospholipid/cholesterol/gamma-HCH transport system permease protein
MSFFHYLGKYFIFLWKVFSRPDNYKLFYRQTIRETMNLGMDSLGIVIIVSAFIGVVMTIQTAYNTSNPLIPRYLVGLTVRDSILLEFSSTIIALILAGKVGSSISSEIGTMRVTEQIDALEMMGVNSANYIVLPKIIAALIFNPLLTLISMIIGITGGYIAGVATQVVTSDEFIVGLQYGFTPFYITYSLVKALCFSFVITSISSYQGYFVSGGSIEVGRSSTRAVVYSSIMILFTNVILTQLLLTS